MNQEASVRQRHSRQALKVALLGAGTVGGQVARLLTEQREELAERVGTPLELVGVAVRDLSVARPGVPTELLTDDAMGLVTRADVDIVIELIGGIEPARSLLLAAIQNGAAVITGNKALLSEHGAELFDAAEAAGVDIYFEAAVAGAIPIVRPLRESLVGDEVVAVSGIVNGTTNFILDKMTTEGLDYAEVLAEAQRLGYAEADPTADVEGHDAAAKAAILASLGFHTRVSFDDVYCEGISKITSQDIDAARDLGFVIKLLAIAQRVGQRINARVHPTLVPISHPLASVNGAYNAVLVEAESAGQLMFLGPGAGGAPTASAVIGDLMTVARNRMLGIALPVQTSYRSAELAPMGEVKSRYYLRMEVTDRPGVLAKVAATFASHGVSVQTVQQRSGANVAQGVAQLSMMTHAASERQMQDCVNDLTGAADVLGSVRLLRVHGD